ncbi:MAG TPA: hypothetical protein VN580_00190 [Clostridia bacterium]|nr:hypothetical protein [Clostridia bacterium]
MLSKKRILTICMAIIIMSGFYIGVSAAAVNLSDEETQRGNNTEAIEPSYVPHECHTGPGHQNCEYVSVEEDCGCISRGFFCCCGRLMSLEKIYCPDHRY